MFISGIDYSKVDWSLDDYTIARQLNIAYSSVRKRRKKLGIPASRKRGQRVNIPHCGGRKPEENIDYEFAWTKKEGTRKRGGAAWKRALKRKYGSSCSLCGYDKSEVPNDCHHIVPVSEGGRNTIRNGVILCCRCHKEVHSGIFSLIPKKD